MGAGCHAWPLPLRATAPAGAESSQVHRLGMDPAHCPPQCHAMPSLLGTSSCTNKEQSAGNSPGRSGSAGCSSSAVSSSPGVGTLSSGPSSSAWPPRAGHCPFPCISLQHCIFTTEDAQHVHHEGALHVGRASTCLAPSSHPALPGEVTIPRKATAGGSGMWVSVV